MAMKILGSAAAETISIGLARPTSIFHSNPALFLTDRILQNPNNFHLPFWHCIWSESVQFSSVAQSCPTLCDPMDFSSPGLPVQKQLTEFTQTHVHRVHDAIKPSHPRSSPSPPAPNPSQHQSLFPMSQLFPPGGQSTGVSALASFLPKNTYG